MQRGDMKPVLFYDGGCALCHGFIRWVAARDEASVFNYAPLGGPTFERLVSVERRKSLPDSVVALTEDGELHLRSDALIYTLRKLGRRRLASAIAIVPRSVRDSVYDITAGVRYGIFGRSQQSCPVIPARMRGRFLD